MVKRPISITVIAWFFIASGIFLIFSAARLNTPMAKSPILVWVLYAMIYIGILAAVASGIGMLKKQNWARFLNVIWGAIGLLVPLFTTPLKMELIPGLLFYAIIVFFLFRPVANRYFSKA